MRSLLTIMTMVLALSGHAQKVLYSPRETGYPDIASYDIIGQINGHLLVLLQGTRGAEIAVYDEGMNKIRSAPINFLKSRIIDKNFFAYPDHFLLFSQHYVDSIYYITRFKGDGNGGVIESPTVMDSIIQPSKKIEVSGRMVNVTNSFRPMFIVLRSENKQWFMILKGVTSEGADQKLEATLFDKDLKPVEHGRFTYSSEDDPGRFSRFVLDNDGDLAFIHSIVEDGDENKVISANLHVKLHGTDTLVSTRLTSPGTVMEEPGIRVDNLNHRFILTTFYYAWGSTNLTGLCNMIWDKQARSLTSPSLTPVPTAILAEARADFTPPEKVLNKFYLRQVYPLLDGGFLVLAELVNGFDMVLTTGAAKYTDQYLKRSDLIQGTGPSLMTPSYQQIPFRVHEVSGWWDRQESDWFGKVGTDGGNLTSGNLLVFMVDHEGKTRSIKVVHKSEDSSPGMGNLSYQTFTSGNVIHLIYNEKLKGHWLPVGVSINVDGTIVPDPVLHSLGRDQFFLPRYGKQVGPKTVIVPCQTGDHLSFAKVDLE